MILPNIWKVKKIHGSSHHQPENVHDKSIAKKQKTLNSPWILHSYIPMSWSRPQRSLDFPLLRFHCQSAVHFSRATRRALTWFEINTPSVENPGIDIEYIHYLFTGHLRSRLIGGTYLFFRPTQGLCKGIYVLTYLHVLDPGMTISQWQ